jgi:hypothetical protein
MIGRLTGSERAKHGLNEGAFISRRAVRDTEDDENVSILPDGHSFFKIICDYGHNDFSFLCWVIII